MCSTTCRTPSDSVNHNSNNKIKIFRPWDSTREKEGFRPVCSKNKETPIGTISGNVSQSTPVPNDLFVMDTVLPAYEFEEYARFLHQENQIKLMNSTRKQRPKKYKCPHCNVGFSNNGQLKGHIRIHTGERPFKCDAKDCGKTFTRNEELTRHKRIHSGLRPYPCTHCGKRFGRKDHLKKHSRTHYQTRGVYAVPVMLPFELINPQYPYLPNLYGF